MKWLKKLADSRAGRFAAQLLGRYFAHDVGRQGAALAYYLLFSVFPLLIFISGLLGSLELDVSGIMASLSSLLPAGVPEMLTAYLTYVKDSSGGALMWFGLGAAIWFPMRAANCLMGAVRRAYHLPRPKKPLTHIAKVLLYTVFLLLMIILSLVLVMAGQRALGFLSRVAAFPVWLVEIWNVLRFGALGTVIFAAVGLLHVMAQDRRQPGRNVVGGVVFSVLAWMALSAAFSFYVENIADYSVIYGTLGAMIVLLVWLNLSAVVLIMGAEVNAALMELRLWRT